MKAIIAAEFAGEQEERLRALDIVTSRVGWGTTGKPMGESDFIAAIGNAAIVITEHDPITQSVIEACPSMRLVISCRGTPVGIDMAAAGERGIEVRNTPGRNADAVADFTIGLMIDVVRQVSASDRHHRTSGWNVNGGMPYLHFRGPEMRNLTLGVVGLGAIGQKVSQRAHRGFDMEVLTTSRTAKDVDGVEQVALTDLLGRADIVSLHCPANEETFQLINDASLALMKPSSYLINVARGSVVDTAAVLRALGSGHLAGAALDVYDPEPPEPKADLFAAPGLTLTPHVAGASSDTVANHSALAVDHIEAWLRQEGT